MKPILGTTTVECIPVDVDIEAMIGTDLCVIAKKGFGKSGLLRVLFEKTYGLIQQIIIDPEGEFHTLREKNEYLIAGGEEADCPATPATAAALAKMLMENPGVSAIIQLDHKGAEPREFVRRFIEAMMEAPKEQWHPVLLCIDETQRFAPQDGKVESSDAMEDMVQRGRKRGITPVFASLRNAVIDKNLTDGISTWMFGRVGTDADRRQVANYLGFTSSSQEAKDLLTLKPRQFWAYGSSVADRPLLFDVADAQTTIVKSGGMVAMPPPPKSLQKLLQAISKAAAPETPAAPVPAAGAAPGVDLEAIRKEAYQKGADETYGRAYAEGGANLLLRLQDWIQEQRERGDGDLDGRDPMRAMVEYVPQARPYVSMDKPVECDFVRTAVEGVAKDGIAKVVRAARAPRPDGELSEGASALITAARMAHRPVSWTEAAMLAGRIPAGGYHNSIMKELREAGWSDPPDNDMAADGPYMAAAELREKMAAGIDGKDKGAARAVFEHLWAVGPRTKAEIAEDTGRQPSGGYWNATWKALRSSPRVHESGGRWDIATILREVAGPPTAQS